MSPLAWLVSIALGLALGAAGFGIGWRRAAAAASARFRELDHGWRRVVNATDASCQSGLRILKAEYEMRIEWLSAALDAQREANTALRERFREQLEESAVPTERRN